MARVGILVAGMHRSGTSALARSLIALGCDAPKNLMPADDHNTAGYWESSEIAALNSDILASAGTSWDSWEHFGTRWYASPVVDGFRDRAQTILATEFGDSALFVLKDPRVCRLMPFWLTALEDFGAVPRVVLPLRNPAEVAASLARRDAIEPAFGFLMWLRNVLDAEAESRQHQRVFLRFEELLADWPRSTAKMEQALGIVWPRRSGSPAVEDEAALSPSLRHHAEGDSSVVNLRWPRLVETTYDILQRWSDGDVLDADLEQLDAVNAMLTQCTPALAHPLAAGMRAGQANRQLVADIEALRTTVEETQHVVAARDDLVESLNQALRDRDQVIANKDRHIAELGKAIEDRDVRADQHLHAIADRDGRIGALNDAVMDRDRQLGSLERAAGDQDAHLDRLQGTIASRNGQIEHLELAVADRDARITNLDAAVADRDGQIDSIQSTIATRDGRIEHLERTVADRDGQIHSLHSTVADRDGQIESLGRAVADRDGQVHSLHGTVADRDGQIESLGRAVADRDGQIDGLHSAMADRDGQIENLGRTVADRDAHVANLDAAIADRDEKIGSLEQSLRDREMQIDALHLSTSWRITAPVRLARPIAIKVVRVPLKLVALGIFSIARLLWRLLPLGRSRRVRWRQPLIRALPQSLATRLYPGPASRTYVPSGHLDLADLNSEAARNQGPVPILFDPDYYLATNEDVRTAGVDPLAHYLECGAVEGRLPIDIDPKEIDPVVLDLHRLDRQVDSTFDAAFYRAIHTDLASLDDDALAEHYQRHGEVEGRVATKEAFLRTLCDNPAEIPIDFRAAQYIELYPDLHDYADRQPLEALRHYMLFGRWEPRLHTLRGDAKQVARKPTVDLGLPTTGGPSKPLCVLAHVYYAELWDELSRYIANLPSDHLDLYVNLVDTTFDQQLLARVRSDFPAARVYISDNAGRDVGGHFRVLRNVQMERYRIFCLVHTKKSPHMSKGEVQLWRRKLLEPLMGSPDIAAQNIRLMLDDDEIGLLGAARCRYTELNDNPSKYFALLERLGIDEGAEDVEFLSGTMMFLRREVVQRLFDATEDVEFEPGDARSTDFHRDGQWAHAVERAFGAVVRDMNYRVEWR